MMADRPILFSAPMVRALLDGKKNQTRRGLTLRGYKDFTEFQPSDTQGYHWTFRRADMCWVELTHNELLALLRWQVGDRLWVKETHAYVGSCDPGYLLFRASDFTEQCDRYGFDKPYPPISDVKWTPCIFMRRKASRLTLSVTDVRVERLQDITQHDAYAEGAERHWLPDHVPLPSGVLSNNSYKTGYAVLWDRINGEGAWEKNPWIVALTFDVEQRNIDN
jgi:hypothetical protein